MAVQLPNWEKTSDMIEHLKELLKNECVVALLINNTVVGYVMPPTCKPDDLRKVK